MYDIQKSYKNKNVLITGGLGFVGSNLAIRLVELGANVTLVDSMIENYGGNLFNIEPVREKVMINISDVRDYHGLMYLVKDKHFLFNLAGQVSHIESVEDPFSDLQINVKGQLAILEAVRRKNRNIRIIFASTRQFYGKPQYFPVDENHPICPTDVNGINKFAGESYHTLYYKVYGLKSTILRMTNVYGPRQLIKHSKQGFIGWFVHNIIVGDKISVFGDGKQIRDLNYVDDVVDALLQVGVNKNCVGEVFNLGCKDYISLIDLAHLMVEVSGIDVPVETVPFPENKKRIDIGDFYTDYSKIKNKIGWEPKVSLREGLKRTFKYYKKYKDHYLND